MDVRILSATHRNLQQEVDEKRFRLDLFYRLNVVRLEIPPLRQRREDIPELARYFSNYYCTQYGKAPAMITPTAKSRTLPLNAKSLNSLSMVLSLSSSTALERLLQGLKLFPLALGRQRGLFGPGGGVSYGDASIPDDLQQVGHVD